MKYIKFYRFLFVCVLFCCQNAKAQNPTIQDLLDQLKQNNPDTTKIKLLYKIATAYNNVDPKKKFYYTNEFRILAEKNNLDSIVANAYLDMGNSYVMRSLLDSALFYFDLGREKSKPINYINGLARSYLNAGYVLDRLERKKEAVKYNEEALKYYKQLKHQRGINQAHTNLGSIYFDLAQYKAADYYFELVAENLKKTPNDKFLIANNFYALGGAKRKLGLTKTAMSYYQKSLAIRTELDDKSGIALSNWGIAQIYHITKEYDKAINHANIAVKHNQLIQNAYQEAASLLTLSELYTDIKNYKKAEEVGQNALKKARESNSFIPVNLALKNLAKINDSAKNLAAALKYKKDFIKSEDSIDKVKLTNDVYVTDLKRINTDNLSLEKNNQLIAAQNTTYVLVISLISFLLLALIILLVLYYRKNVEKNKINELLQVQTIELAKVNAELTQTNEELFTSMEIVSNQNIELEKLNRIKNKFFSIVSHDLRSPLNSLKMLFELYRAGGLNENELKTLLGKLEHNISITAGFLDNLLEWSKSQLDGIIINPVAFDIKQLVDDNINLMHSQIDFKQLYVENQLPINSLAFADKNMINVVIRNLLANAIKFCNPNDKIYFNTTVNERNITLTITDTGLGISDDDQKKLFNLTHTVSTGTSGEKGYQIGLILCKDLVEQNNGTISVTSTLNKGTTFYIELPRY